MKHQKTVQTPFGKMENHSFQPMTYEETYGHEYDEPPLEETYVHEQTDEEHEQAMRKEIYLHGLFVGIIAGALAMAIMVGVLEKL